MHVIATHSPRLLNSFSTSEGERPSDKEPAWVKLTQRWTSQQQQQQAGSRRLSIALEGRLNDEEGHDDEYSGRIVVSSVGIIAIDRHLLSVRVMTSSSLFISTPPGYGLSVVSFL